ncbi:hypothetical protein EXU48_12190 [Occultella glacieicola]|uniref:Metal-dependent HD superfamily phosphohydrolase n=1 Tax=Occultella glacieicola TaxID=2518684 RepID=A0ABY2E3L6_9MICO|nr:hypothetical protein [Occultella glacieicola]TDE94190.1 hypothetical protein EXU48_12190 [Occultella glacieicola]
MGVIDAPQWVLSAWRRSLEAVGATADREAIEARGEALIERWSRPDRIHHNVKRLIGVLARVDELAPETHHPDIVRIAAWYHGAVFNAAARQAYAHKGGVDEAASAALARTELADLGVPEKVVNRIAELISVLARHDAPATDIDAQALCDADLGGLASEPQKYEAYRREVRQEYQHIPQRDYVEARLAIVTKLLGRTHLFRSPLGRDWEDAARENLNAELARLTNELTGLPPRDPDEPDPSRVDVAQAEADPDADDSGFGLADEAEEPRRPAEPGRPTRTAVPDLAVDRDRPVEPPGTDGAWPSLPTMRSADVADDEDETQHETSLSRPPRMPARQRPPSE